MGYVSTLVMILFGVSVMFYLYAGFINDPITQSYGIDAEHAANLSSQMNDPFNSMQATGASAGSFDKSNYLYNALIGLIAGAGIAAAVSLLYGGNFAVMYMLPAAAVGGVIGIIYTPLDMINKILSSGNMPAEIGTIFTAFMMTGLLLLILSFIFGGDRT